MSISVSNEMAFNFGYDARRSNLPLNIAERVSWQEGWLKADGEIADEISDEEMTELWETRQLGNSDGFVGIITNDEGR